MPPTEKKPLRLVLFLLSEVGMIFVLIAGSQWSSEDRVFDIIRIVTRIVVLLMMAYAIYQCYRGLRSASWFCIVLGFPQLAWAIFGPILLGLPLVSWWTIGLFAFGVSCIALGVTGLRLKRESTQEVGT